MRDARDQSSSAGRRIDLGADERWIVRAGNRGMLSSDKRKHCARRATLLAVMCVLLNAPPTSAGDPKRGEPMYQRYCSGCHGVDGRGGGKNFMPHVGALTKKGHTELLDDGYMGAIITEGGPAYGKSAYMPAFKGTLSPEDIADVIAYVRTFPLY